MLEINNEATSIKIKNELPSWQKLQSDLFRPDTENCKATQELLKFYNPQNYKFRKMILTTYCFIAKFFPKNSDIRRISVGHWHNLYCFVLNLVSQNKQHAENLSNSESSADILFRDYYQMPCSQDTLSKRVSYIQGLVPNYRPILIIGDDDLQSLALAKAGYSDITVIEIDGTICDKIKTAAKQHNYNIQVISQDIATIPANFIRPYAAVLMDPPCHYEGFALFFAGATRLCRPHNSGCYIFLSTQPLLYLEAGYNKMLRDLSVSNAQLVLRHPGFNLYPLPRWPKILLNFLLRRMLPKLRTSPMQYFTSDFFIFHLAAR